MLGGLAAISSVLAVLMIPRGLDLALLDLGARLCPRWRGWRGPPWKGAAVCVQQPERGAAVSHGIDIGVPLRCDAIPCPAGGASELRTA